MAVRAFSERPGWSFISSACVLLLLPILLFPSAATPQVPSHSRIPSGAASYTFALPERSLEDFVVETFASVNVIQYSLISNASVTVSLMNSEQFQAFRSSRSDISAASLYYQNGTASKGSIRVGSGSFVLLVYAYTRGSTANVMLSFAGPLPSPEPLGIASFGLLNQSGIDSPYSVRSTDVVGVVGITSIQAFNRTAGAAVGCLGSAQLRACGRRIGRYQPGLLVPGHPNFRHRHFPAGALRQRVEL